MPSSPLSPVDNGVGLVSSLAQSISKPTRSMSTSSGGSYSSEPSTPCSMYPKAPGSERSERCGSREDDHQVSKQTIILFRNCFIGKLQNSCVVVMLKLHHNCQLSRNDNFYFHFFCTMHSGVFSLHSPMMMQMSKSLKSKE